MNLRMIWDIFKLQRQFGGKPWFKSFTGWGLLLLLAGVTGLDAVCGTQVQAWGGTEQLQGLLPSWACGPDLTEKLGLILGIFGMRRRL